MEQGTIANISITTDLTKVNVRVSATFHLTYRIGKTFLAFNLIMLVIRVLMFQHSSDPLSNDTVSKN